MVTKKFKSFCSVCPKLLAEWDYSKNCVHPELISYCSNKKRWWVCSRCSYSWEASTSNRVRVNSGCPACAGKVVVDRNRLSLAFPGVAAQWDYTKNFPLTPDKVSVGSTKRVWWVCDKSHSWSTMVCNRASKNNKTGCPYCTNQKVLPETSLSSRFPELIKFWDYDKNKVNPGNIFPGTVKKFWWLCEKGHSYEMSPNNKTNAFYKRGCPYCSGRRLSDDNRLSVLFPVLVSEWDYEKNYPLTPRDVSFGSNKRVWWKCSRKGHEWSYIIAKRTSGEGCPYCSRHKIDEEDSIASTHPHLLSEWDYSKNISITPTQVSFGSNKCVWWVCPLGHGYKSTVYNRGYCGTGCPLCYNSGSYRMSAVSQLWLDELEVPDSFREFKISTTRRKFIVDGFDPSTNTVYEFLGDFWHGNPKVFCPDKMNSKTGCTYGKLYLETLNKVEELKEAGYKVVYIWEKDFRDKLKKRNKGSNRPED